MFKELKEQIGITETAARVKFRNGRIVYGVITNLIPERLNMKKIWFYPNRQLTEADLHEGILMNEENIENIELYLK